MRLPPRQSTAEADLMIPFQLVCNMFLLCLEAGNIQSYVLLLDVIFVNIPTR